MCIYHATQSRLNLAYIHTYSDLTAVILFNLTQKY